MKINTTLFTYYFVCNNGCANVILMDNKHNLWVWGTNEDNECLIDISDDNIKYNEYFGEIMKPIKIECDSILKKLKLREIYDIQITCFKDDDLDEEVYITGIY